MADSTVEEKICQIRSSSGHCFGKKTIHKFYKKNCIKEKGFISDKKEVADFIL